MRGLQNALEEQRAAHEEQTKAAEAEHIARRKALEEARDKRATSNRTPELRASEARIEALRDQLDEMRSAASEQDAESQVKAMLTPGSASEQGQSAAAAQVQRRESLEGRREQAAKDSARRRGKIDLRRALSAKVDAQLGGYFSPKSRKARAIAAAGDASPSTPAVSDAYASSSPTAT